MKYKGIFASSQDPAQLSLTIESILKVFIGIAGFFAAQKGLDPNVATSQAQALMDVGTQIVVAGWSVWNGLNVFWGLARKFLAYFGSEPSSSSPSS